MTVSDYAKIRWFFYRTAFAILFCLNMFGPQTLYAQSVDRDTAACYAGRLLPPYSLVEELEKYSIKAKSNPPSRILKPGETYQITYDIETSCPYNCGKVKQHTLSHRAVLGADRIKIQSSSYVTTGVSTIGRFTCGDRHTRVLTFTIPSPKTLGAQGQEVKTVTMGVCPPNTNSGSATAVARSGSIYGYNCAGHTIRVSSESLSGWKVSVLKTHQRAIGAGVNRVPANQPLTLSAAITKPRGWPAAGPGPMAEIRQITSSIGPVSTAPLSRQPVPNIAGGTSANMRFTLRAHAPGVYSYKACVTGLKQGSWPAPDVCGPPTAITVGAAALASWQVGAVQVNTLGRLSNTTPANRAFKVQTTIANISKFNNPSTGRTVVILVRGQGRSGVHGRIYGPRGPVAAGQTITKVLNSAARAAGAYEIKACIADSGGAALPDMICGPWSPIIVGAKRIRPAPQPVAPALNTCTGGRSKNAQGRCVCPTGSFWNPNPGFKRCYTCTGGRVWNAQQRRCACPSGVKWNQRANRCGTSFQAAPTPQIQLRVPGKKITIRCSGGTVRNGACLCPRGFTRKTIKKNVYVCKPPSKRPIPGASRVQPNSSSSATTLQNQLKKPKTNKMRCLGGRVKGPLCWCGIGRFPKKIGNNAYRCQ